MISKFLSFFICAFCMAECWADSSTPHQAGGSSSADLEVVKVIPSEYASLREDPVFQEAYKRLCVAESQGEGMDPLSVIWALALQKGTYIEVSQKLADYLAEPDDTTQMHWALPDAITVLLVANQSERAKPWIKSLKEMDEKFLLPLYPLLSLTPGLEGEGPSQEEWENYQLQAFTEKGAEHIAAYKAIMDKKDNYSRDEILALIVENNLL